MKLLRIYILLFSSLLISLVVHGNSFSKDSLLSTAPEIKIIDVPTKSAIALSKLQSLQKTFSEDKDIQELQTANNELLIIIDSLLYIDQLTELSTKNIRHLQNKQIFWQFYLDRLIELEKRLKNEIESIESTSSNVEEINRQWISVQNRLSNTHTNDILYQSTQEVVQTSNTVLKLIEELRADLLTAQSLDINKKRVIVGYIGQIENIVQQQSSEILVRHQNSLFAIEWSNSQNTNLFLPIQTFYRLEVKQLILYAMRNSSQLFIMGLLIFILSMLFRSMKRSMLSGKETETTITKPFYLLLKQYYSIAFIIGILSSFFIFSNQPLLFRDLSRLLISIPLILVIRKSVKKQLFLPILCLFLMLFFQALTYVYPPNHIIYRATILFIGTVELFALLKMLRHFGAVKFSRIIVGKTVIYILWIHITIVVIGLLATIVGATVLAEWFINLTLINAFAGILLYIASLIFIGLTETVIDSKKARDLNAINTYGTTIKEKVSLLINIGAIVLLFVIVLKNMRIDTFVLGSFSSFIHKEMSLGSLSFSISGIVIFFLVIWCSIVLSRIIQTVLEEDVLVRLKLAKGMPHTIAVMVRYSIITLGVFLAVSAAGLPLQNLSILLGAFGVGIGFGLQNIFNNLVSGLILLFERPIQIGDTIEVGELIGNVKSIGIRSSNVRTFDGAEVIVPNGQLISNEVVNWTLSDQTRRIEVIAGVAYGTDPHKVKSLLTKELENHPDIIKKPEPVVLFSNMGESSLDFRLLFWTANIGSWLHIKSEVTFMVHDILKAEGIEIPFPQRDLHIRSIDDSLEIKKKEK